MRMMALLFVFAALSTAADISKARRQNKARHQRANFLIEGVKPKVAVYIHSKTKGQTNRAILYGSTILKFK